MTHAAATIQGGAKEAKPCSDCEKHSKKAHQEEIAKERLSFISPTKAEQTIDKFETKSQEEAKRRIFNSE